MTITTSLRLGYDVAIGIDTDSYTISTDANGRAWAFQFDRETEPHLTDAVEHALSDYRPIEDLEVAPGYIRVRFPSPDSDTNPTDLVGALRDAAAHYNEQHAEYEDTEVSLTREHYVGTYDSGEGLTRENFLIRNVDADDAPGDSDEPVWAYERDDAGETVLSDASRFAFRLHLPFNASKMYDDSGTRNYETINLAVEWDREEVKDHLRKTVEDLVPWPGDPRKTIPRVAVYPTHVEVDYYDGHLGAVGGVADKTKKALLNYNRRRPLDTERPPRGSEVKHPRIDFRGTPFAEAIPHGKTAADWIQAHGLDNVDGDPVNTEEPAENESDTGGLLSWGR